MVKMTQSFKVWCLKYHSDIYPLLMFGHLEEFTKTKELSREYLDWCKTDEGRQYLKGGSKYKEDEHMNDLISRKSALALAKDICILTKDGTMYKHRCIDPDDIKELPTARHERTSGDWITVWDEDDPETSSRAKCSECGMIQKRPVGHFCKWCGVDMRGDAY